MRELKRFLFDISAKQCIFSKTSCPHQLPGEDFTNGTVVMQMWTIHACIFFCSPRFGIFNPIHSLLAESSLIPLKIMSSGNFRMSFSVRTIIFLKKMLYFVVMKARKTLLPPDSKSREYSVIFHFPRLGVSRPSLTNLELNRNS